MIWICQKRWWWWICQKRGRAFSVRVRVCVAEETRRRRAWASPCVCTRGRERWACEGARAHIEEEYNVHRRLEAAQAGDEFSVLVVELTVKGHLQGHDQDGDHDERGHEDVPADTPPARRVEDRQQVRDDLFERPAALLALKLRRERLERRSERRWAKGATTAATLLGQAAAAQLGKLLRAFARQQVVVRVAPRGVRARHEHRGAPLHPLDASCPGLLSGAALAGTVDHLVQLDALHVVCSARSPASLG